MSKIKEIIEKHLWITNDFDYNTLLTETSIDEDDIKYFNDIIEFSKQGGTSRWDMFMDHGGLEIASILLAEIRRIKRI